MVRFSRYAKSLSQRELRKSETPDQEVIYAWSRMATHVQMTEHYHAYTEKYVAQFLCSVFYIVTV